MKMTAENLNDLTNFLRNLTDIQLAVLRGKIDEEEKIRNEKKIEQYYNRLADLIDEIKENGFEIYYDNQYRFEVSDLAIEVAEERA